MIKEKIVSEFSDSCNKRFPPVHVSNRLDLLAASLVDALSEKGGPLRKLVITPTSDIKDFLIQQITKLQGSLFGIRFLTLPQAVQHFIKLLKQRDLFFPNHYNLMLHIEYELRELLKQNRSDLLPLKDYIKQKEERLLSLSEELSHVFLHYGTYGGAALKEWEEKTGWIQTIWHKIHTIWQFPIHYMEGSLSPSIEMDVHLFALPYIPPLLQKMLDHLAQHYKISYYAKNFTPFYVGDLLSPSNLAKQDRHFQKKGASLESRLAFDALVSETNSLASTLSTYSRETTLWLYEKEVIETFQPPDALTTLSHIQKGIFELENTPPPHFDDSLQIHEAISKKREVEILRHNIEKLIYEKKISYQDIAIFVKDMDGYFPFIQMIFGSSDSPLGYKVSGLSALLKSFYFQTLHRFFALAESRFEKELILELFSSRFFKEKHDLSEEDLFLLEKITDATRISWGFDQEMRKMVLETEAISSRGSWQFGFEEVIKSLPYLDSIIDLSKVETLGKLLSLIETLYKDLASLKTEERSLTEWIKTLKTLILNYFIETEETSFFLDEFARLSLCGSFIDAPYSYLSIKKIIEEIFHKGEVSEYTDKPSLLFQTMEEPSMQEKDLICILGLDEDSFPKKETFRSLNELKYHPKSDRAPKAFEKDRYFFFEAILNAKKHLVLSYTGIDECSKKERGPSLCIQELFHILQKEITQKHPPFSFSKFYTTATHFSSSDAILAKAFYSPLNKVEFATPLVKRIEEIHKVEIKELIKLAKHPIQFYANHTLGVFFEKTVPEGSEFFLSYLDKAILRTNLLRKGKEKLLSEIKKKNLLPTALFEEVARSEIFHEFDLIEQGLKSLCLSKNDFYTITFDQRAKKQEILSENHLITPALKRRTSQGDYLIYGTLSQGSRRGVLTYKDTTIKEVWKAWPELILLSLFYENQNLSLLSLEEKKERPLKIDPQSLDLFLDYYKFAKETVSPLMPEAIEPFLKQNYDQVKKSPLFEDRYLEFFQPNLTHKWEPYLEALSNSLIV